MDSDGGVEAEAAGALPGEHVGHGLVVEEAAFLEDAELAALEGALKRVDDVGREMRGLVEGHAAVVLLDEEAVEDHDVEVEVGVQRRAEAVEEGDGQGGVMGEEGADPLGHGEDPLAQRQGRQEVVGEVGGHLAGSSDLPVPSGPSASAPLGCRSPACSMHVMYRRHDCGLG